MCFLISLWRGSSAAAPRSLGAPMLRYMTKRSTVHVTWHARHCYLVHGVAESSRTVSRVCKTSSGSDTCSGGNTISFPLSSVPDERKKRPRTAFTPAQIKSLEAEFEKNKYLSVAKRLQLSKSLKLTETQVRR
jgi:Homeobox domain.